MLKILLLSSLLVMPLLASADESSFQSPEGNLSDESGTFSVNHYLIDGGAGDTVSVGLIAISIPSYVGSDTQRHALFPMINAKWGDQRYFASSFNGVGMNLAQVPKQYKVGIALEPNWGRRESNDNDLDGMGDINAYVVGSLFAQYRVGPVMLNAKLKQSFYDNRGYNFEIGADSFIKITDTWVVTYGPAVSYASKDYMQSFYGVSGGQAAKSGYAEYHPGSGIDLLKFNASTIYKINDNWRALGIASYRHLTNDASDAGFVNSRNQWFVGLGADYLF